MSSSGFTIFIPVPSALLQMATEGFAAADAATGNMLSDCPVSVSIAFIAAVFVLKKLMERSVPVVVVPCESDAEKLDTFTASKKLTMAEASPKDPAAPGQIRCWDPCTMDVLGHVKAFTPAEVRDAVDKARQAQQKWKMSTFAERRHLLNVIHRCILKNMETIVRVACRDSGKTRIDAVLGDILTSAEKLRWVVAEGEAHLKPEYRSSGRLNAHKTSRVEFYPVGVVGAIVPWNYPFHNILNPLIAALFAGNSIVIKPSEYSSWSTQYCGRLLRMCLEAAGAPVDLVQIVTGFGDAGTVLAEGTVDKLIFVGSVGVGKKVQEACAKSLTPLVLELGGKDPFILCDDASPGAIAQLAVRGVFQNMGQNCAGPERFLVYDKIYDEFCATVTELVARMHQGPTLSSGFVDCGACRLPQQLTALQALVDDAVKHGARVAAGGFIPRAGSRLGEGQFYPPTVLCDVTEDMRVMKEEIFGPIMCVIKVKGNSDAEAIRIANNCDFGLSSACFSARKSRASKIISSLNAGMGSVNDLEGVTYMSQSLPFGGVKSSGYDRFAGVEGLRGLCHIKSVVEDRVVLWGAPFMALPPPLTYPAGGVGGDFTMSLIRMLYGFNALEMAAGLLSLLENFMLHSVPKNSPRPTGADDKIESAKGT